ncbi:MAG: sigma-70 family RNA polymerase sigma factor [Hyphomonadaceae bacterium]
MTCAALVAVAFSGTARAPGATELHFDDAAKHDRPMTRSETANARLMPLLAAARAGNSNAYAALLSALAALLRPFVRRHLQRHESDVEDVLQDVLLAIHMHRESYDASRQPMTAWVYAIARYKVIDHLRREGLRAHIPLDGMDDLFAADTADAGDAQRDADALVARLPEQQRRAVRLVKLDELSVREAAAETGLSETAVKVNVHRAIKNLMRFVARDESK